MYNRMLSDGLAVGKMLTLIFHEINELIAKDHPEFQGLIDLVSCTIHTVCNAFGKGIKQYGKDIDQL